MTDYTNYKAEDFINDEAFVSFILEENTSFSEDWAIISANEQVKKEAIIAKIWIETLSAQKNKSQNLSETKSLIWKNILQTKNQKNLNIRKFVAAAAVVLFIIGIGILKYSNSPSNKVIADYGSIKQFNLTDSSSIELYGNSVI
jgi:transmembrane sensor